ncbi:MAG: DUF3857 domain-containing protein [Acidobacteria bacterium]|nr:DUF3857 domain-containing protein [Acidobacteriota bacterium]
MRITLRLLLTFAFAVGGTSAAVAANADDRAPDWLAEAAKATVPTYQVKDVPAVVLVNDQSIEVDASGMITVTQRYAIKCLTRTCRRYAEADALYLQGSSKVRDLRAWLVRPGGTVKTYGKETVLDQMFNPDDVYNEYRMKLIPAEDDVDVNYVFGYEAVVEDRPQFTQDEFAFQDGGLPVLTSRYSLELPADWRANSVTFNHDEIKPTVNGSRYVWEMHDLAPIPPEPESLSMSNLAPRIAVNYYAASGNSHVYDTWRDVSRWYTDLSASSVTLDDNIAVKARELTASATTELDRIKAIAAYVQNIRYIAIDLGVAHGGGYKPRPANLVMERGFGDCKDKANLMRTMLKAVKIDAHLVMIYSGDPTYVRAEWASPQQFNHCIIAIAVGPETKAPSVVSSDKLGRLMIFDPTDPYTQVGDLPGHEQGSLAVVAAGSDGDLIKMPVLPAESNRVERQAEVTLNPDGSIAGKISQRAFGQEAVFERAKEHELSASEYKGWTEKWLSTRVKGSSVTTSARKDMKADGEYDLDLEFSAPTYAQLMQGRLMMFKPAMVGRLDQFVQIEGKRMTPMLLDSSNYSETIKVKLPDGFAVDEMPDPDTIETPFGRYSSKYEVSGGYLIFSRKLELSRSVIPASQYNEVGKFFGVVRNAEVAPVVLVKK